MNFAIFSAMTIIGSFAWCWTLAWFGARIARTNPELINDPEAMYHAIKSQSIPIVLFVLLLVGFAPYAPAQSLTALASFGGVTPGWRQPGEPLGGDAAGTNDGTSYLYLQASNNERGLAYGNGHLYLVSHANVNGSTANVRILDAISGIDTGGLNNTGVTGGTFAVNAGAAGSDGAIYVGNLTTQSTTTPFKIYKWANEGSVPVVAYSGDAGLPIVLIHGVPSASFRWRPVQSLLAPYLRTYAFDLIGLGKSDKPLGPTIWANRRLHIDRNGDG